MKWASNLHGKNSRSILNTAFVPALLLIVALLFFHGHPHLVTALYFGSMLSSIAQLLIIVSGLAFVMSCGGIDLSIGGQVFLIVVSMSLVAGRQAHPALILLTGLLVGLLCGCVNGLLVAALGVPPFVATFASSFVFSGVAKILVTTGAHISTLTDIPLSGKGFFVFHLDFLTALTALVLTGFLLNRTYWGRHTLAVGTNKRAAQRAGLRIGQIQWCAYTYSGLTNAMAAMVLFANEGLAITSVDTELMLSAITAVVLGNANLLCDKSRGARVRIAHIAAAVLLLRLINICADEIFHSEYVQQITTSVILFLAFAADRRSRRRERDDIRANDWWG
jgi:ribose/xylose/arabinose/galactoside ABC-type transport system permease subunit